MVSGTTFCEVFHRCSDFHQSNACLNRRPACRILVDGCCRSHRKNARNQLELFLNPGKHANRIYDCFSCPSVHTYLAFSSAMVIYHYYKKSGIGVFVFAALIGFSRMYFFVHYPTDVLLGAGLGVLTAFE